MDHFLQPPLPNDDDDEDDDDLPPPPSPLASMQMSNAFYNDLDFDHGHGDGGPHLRYEAISDDDVYGQYGGSAPKRLKTDSGFMRQSKSSKTAAAAAATVPSMRVLSLGCGFESPEEGEISDDPDVYADSERSSSRISENKGKSDKIQSESFGAEAALEEASQYSSLDPTACPLDDFLGDVGFIEESTDDAGFPAVGADVAEMVAKGDEVLKLNHAHDNGSDFEIIDDLSSDNGDEIAGDSDDSEVDMDEDEIEAMLDEGIPISAEVREKCAGKGKMSMSGGAVDFQAPTMQDKVILVEKGQDPFDILPEGWLVVTHQSGMPIYLHKQTRVCTVSRPYFLGPGSARKHEIPLSAIPCLQYRKALSKDISVEGKPTDTRTAASHDASETPSNSVNDAADETKTSADDEEEINGDGSVQQDVTITTTTSIAGEAAAAPEVRAVTVPTKVQSAEDHKKSNSLSPLQFRAYCQNLFEFKTITVRRFRRWKDRRKHNLLLKKASRPTLPPSTNLITCAIPADKESHSSFRRKAFVLNPAGKSAVCILHEYAQHTMRIQPRYIFQELENSQMPYSATVVINDIRYGTGYATSKKMAKLEAARITLKILIPEIGKVKTDEQIEDLSYFDEIKIEDPRVVDLCNKAGHPTPYQILGECLKRNYGMGDTQVQMEINTVKHQKSEFIMRVGRHEAKVICKNKREGKQQAAQAILQMMHPHIRTWGSLLRLYAKASEIKDKREEEYSVTKLQTMAHPNKAILEKLRQEMTKLYNKHDAFQSNIKGKMKIAAPDVMISSELRAVDL